MSDRDPSTNDDDSTPANQDDEVGITDDQLPEDLRPTDDNPLAKPPTDDGDDDDQGISLGPDGPQ